MMTSKERTIEKIKSQEQHNQRELKKYGKVSVFSQKELYYYKEVLKDLEILDMFRNSGYFVTDNGDDDFRLTFGVHGYDVDDFIEWKTGKKKKTLF